VRGNG